MYCGQAGVHHEACAHCQSGMVLATVACLWYYICSQDALSKDVAEGPGVQAALDLFEAKWEELIGLPSRQSAADDPEVRDACGVYCKT